MDKTKLTREVVAHPAYDKRPKYGIHGMNLTFYLKGPEGAVQFVIYTNWQLPHVRKEGETKGWEPFMWQPMAADVGYHSPKPTYEGQTPMDGNCHLLGGPCYYDGSGLAAEDMLTLMIEKGSEAMWEKLAEFYEARLCAVPEVTAS